MKFCRHLREADQDFIPHLFDAYSYGGKSLEAAFYFFVHGLFPFLFEKSGSETIQYVDVMIKMKESSNENVGKIENMGGHIGNDIKCPWNTKIYS